MYLNRQRVKATTVCCKDPEILKPFSQSVPNPCQWLRDELGKHGMTAWFQTVLKLNREGEMSSAFSWILISGMKG